MELAAVFCLGNALKVEADSA
ncbi:protein of unknown function [Cyanobium sp. NIES-981]|nr:protein of unknown function [Cyanobium sp. NIES-981]